MALDTTVGGTASDSYITLAEWQAYWSARGVDLTAHGHDASHEANLRRAADALDRRYSWKGYTVSRDQALAWPRADVGYVGNWDVLSTTIPKAIKDAQAELAYIIHEGGDPLATVTGGAVKRERVKADVVETETEYAAPRETARYVAIEGLVRDYTLGMDSARIIRG